MKNFIKRVKMKNKIKDLKEELVLQKKTLETHYKQQNSLNSDFYKKRIIDTKKYIEEINDDIKKLEKIAKKPKYKELAKYLGVTEQAVK
jgi:predicted transcriptional regulator